jgi:hypothetical protein
MIKAVETNRLRDWLELRKPVTVLDVRSDEDRAQWAIPTNCGIARGRAQLVVHVAHIGVGIRPAGHFDVPANTAQLRPHRRAERVWRGSTTRLQDSRFHSF